MSDGWSKEELSAAVNAYVEMQRKVRNGDHFTKKSYYDYLGIRAPMNGGSKCSSSMRRMSAKSAALTGRG